VDLVAQDDVLGARLALDHLHDLGHRRIQHLAGAQGQSFDLRRETYLTWMAERGLTRHARVAAQESSEPGGYSAARTLLDVPTDLRPTALFAGNDALAVGALAAVRDAGLGVPGDVSVSGFDGTSLAAAPHILLTTVDTDIAGMGRRAAELLLARIADPGRERTEILPEPSVTVRGTTGAAPGA
jgi:DNA-binding LacI/PurR family transcriptional regulator